MYCSAHVATAELWTANLGGSVVADAKLQFTQYGWSATLTCYRAAEPLNCTGVTLQAYGDQWSAPVGNFYLTVVV